MHFYQTDDKRDTGEWVAPDCEVCEVPVPSVGQRNGTALCQAHWDRCDDCHEAEGTLDLPDGGRVCVECAGERFDAQTADAGHENDSVECKAMREAQR